MSAPGISALKDGEDAKWAHAEVRRLRDGKQPIPSALARLEHRYQEQSRAARGDRHAA